MGVGLAAAVALLAGEVWGEDRFDQFTSQPGALVLALILGGTALGATAATFQRVPAAFAIAAFAVLPLRLPIQIGGETNFLLIPLYGVIAGGFLRGLWLCARPARGRAADRERAPQGEPPAVRYLSIALAISLVVYALGHRVVGQPDQRGPDGRVLPRSVRLDARAPSRRPLAPKARRPGPARVGDRCARLRRCSALWQYVTRDLLLNKDLKDANELHLYFRVNSLFRDPERPGPLSGARDRSAVGAWIAWQRPRREAVVGLAAAAVMLAALTLTYSQTSFAALAVGLGLLVWFRFGDARLRALPRRWCRCGRASSSSSAGRPRTSRSTRTGPTWPRHRAGGRT